MDPTKEANSQQPVIGHPVNVGQRYPENAEPEPYSSEMTHAYRDATSTFEPYILGTQCHICGWEYVFNGRCERCGN